MKKIVLIEDDELIRLSTLEMLETEGYQAFGAENGLIGLEVIRQHLPDLIICDITMPILNGYEVLTTLHKAPETALIPFIFLTARSDMASLRQGMELGADDYLVKPFSLNHLRAAIQTRLKKQELVNLQYQTELNEVESNLFDLLQYPNLNELEQIARNIKASAITVYLPQFTGSAILLQAKSYYSSKKANDNSPFLPQVVQQTFHRKQAAYYKLDNHQHLAYLPLIQRDDALGVLAIALQPGDPGETSQLLQADEQRKLLFLAIQLTRSVVQARLVEETAQLPELRKSNELKSSLLASVSHDLHTPLTSIKTAVVGLSDPDIKLTIDEQHEYLQIIETEVDRLDQLLSKVLNLSRIESGALLLEKGLFFLPEIVNTLVDRLTRTPILRKRLILTNFEAFLPLVPVDYMLIEQVFANLLENAAKYSASDSPICVKISQTSRPHLLNGQLLSKESSEPNNGTEAEQLGVMVAISDQGIGISQIDLEQIFVKFYRVSSQDNNYAEVKGSGLGLAICKGIVEAHDGSIWASSHLQQGSTLAFWIPL